MVKWNSIQAKCNRVKSDTVIAKEINKNKVQNVDNIVLVNPQKARKLWININDFPLLLFNVFFFKMKISMGFGLFFINCLFLFVCVSVSARVGVCDMTKTTIRVKSVLFKSEFLNLFIHKRDYGIPDCEDHFFFTSLLPLYVPYHPYHISSPRTITIIAIIYEEQLYAVDKGQTYGTITRPYFIWFYYTQGVMFMWLLNDPKGNGFKNIFQLVDGFVGERPKSVITLNYAALFTINIDLQG